MSRVLLIAATTGYQIRSFGEAAERLGVELVLATDRCHVLDDPWRDNAIAISGTGGFTADTTTATTGSFGQEENLCSKFGNNEFSNDLWYEWTATSTGDTHVLTCNTGSGDSKLGAIAADGLSKFFLTTNPTGSPIMRSSPE